MTGVEQEKTGLGNYFVANYPPFSAWKPAHLPAARAVLASPPKPGTPLGLYLHIPFCRKRCKFCYFRVYTDKNARDIEVYLDALVKEVSLYARQPIVGDRPLKFIYFGGGTPSYLSASQLRDLMTRLKEVLPWDGTEEVTFECEPGTLQEHKLEALRDMGVTRLSLGIENFDYDILEYNGRAHHTEEIYRAYGRARQLGFDQINIDLIAGMAGETRDNWKECVRKTLELAPESVTIYQMELPYNTVFSKELTSEGLGMRGEGRGARGEAIQKTEDSRQEEKLSLSLAPRPSPLTPHSVADWPTKRAWVNYAFDEMQKHGYEISSAYTLVKNKGRVKFVYRDSLWHGADMFGTGVASFGHAGGVHLQNVDTWEDYIRLLDRDELPLGRALPVQPHQLLIREMILQLKTGRLDAAYFRAKFGTDILDEFSEGFRHLEDEGFLNRGDDTVELTRQGFLQADRLLPTFFEPQHRNTRYT